MWPSFLPRTFVSPLLPTTLPRTSSDDPAVGASVEYRLRHLAWRFVGLPGCMAARFSDQQASLVDRWSTAGRYLWLPTSNRLTTGESGRRKTFVRSDRREASLGSLRRLTSR
jgi:hypothetical protein